MPSLLMMLACAPALQILGQFRLEGGASAAPGGPRAPCHRCKPRTSAGICASLPALLGQGARSEPRVTPAPAPGVSVVLWQWGRSISSSQSGYSLGQLQPGSSFGPGQCPAAPHSSALAQRSSSGLSLIFLPRFGVRRAAMAFCQQRCAQQHSPWGCLCRKETTAHSARCTGHTHGARSVPGARPLLSCSQPRLLSPRWGGSAWHRHPVAVRKRGCCAPCAPQPSLLHPTEQSRDVGRPSCSARGWIGCANISQAVLCRGAKYNPERSRGAL